MRPMIDWMTKTGRRLWTHVSAAVAVALIALALWIGYRIGAPASPTGPGATTQAAIGSTGTPAAAALYTCSMHPSVRLTDPDAKCPICFMSLIPVTGDDTGAPNQLVLDDASARLSDIETAKVAQFFPTAEVRLYGKLTYDETSVARITSYFAGRIERLFVNYVGVPVAKGDHLAEMYSPQLLAAFEELRQARIAVDTSTSSSDIVRVSTERTLDAAREKLRLFGLTEPQIAGAEAGEASHDRLTVYAPMAGIVTHLAVRDGDYVETGSPLATVADLSRLWLDLEAYESQLSLLRWGHPVTFTVEAHPGRRFEGRVSFIEPIVDDRTRTAAVRVAVDNRARELKPGMFATAIVRPRVASGGAVLSDELAGRWVCPMHPTVVKDGPGPCDVCGMDLVTAESLGVVGDPAAAREPLVIPRTAALLTGTRAVVYVKVPGAARPTYETRTVDLGVRAGDLYVVERGLSAGEEVVVNGAFRIDSAMQILAKPSMMTPSDRDAASARRAPVPASFIDALAPVYEAYLNAQERLAADDLAGYTGFAVTLGAAVEAVPTAGLVGEPLAAWRRAAAKLRHRDVPAAIDDARTRFERQGEAIVKIQRRFGHRGDETWHLAFCPMAFDNRGAEWVQRGTTINNPYFGDSMLRCGTLRGDLRPLDADGAAEPVRPAGGGDDE